MVYSCNGILLSHVKEHITDVCNMETWMNPKKYIILKEKNPETQKHICYDLICVNFKNRQDFPW